MMYLCIVNSNNYYSMSARMGEAPPGGRFALQFVHASGQEFDISQPSCAQSAHLWPRNSALYSGSAKQLIPTPNPSRQKTKTSPKVFHKSSSATASSPFIIWTCATCLLARFLNFQNSLYLPVL